MRQAERIRYLALAAQREGNRRLATDLEPLGISPAQSEVLRILGDHEPLSLTAVGEMLVCQSGSSPSRLLDGLVAGGLVTRVAADDDRRQVILTLTETGRAFERRVREIEDAMYNELDAASAGLDMTAVLAYLERTVGTLPAGRALQARIAAEG